jgi:hypothetical protein
MTDNFRPNIQFFCLIEQARPPQPADRAAMGTLPIRAYRYCEAVTSASGYGWWIFSPMDIQIIWDGSDIFWSYGDGNDWLKLMPSAQFPSFSRQFDAIAPSGLQGRSPPFLSALPEAGTLQIWTGLIARTAPDWHLLLRAPANVPLPGGFSLYEGIVETDRRFGPLFVNLRFTRSHEPIRLKADFPLVQAQPVHREMYAKHSMATMSVVGSLSSLGAGEWDAYRTTFLEPISDHDRPFGNHAVAARKRRSCPAGAHRQTDTATTSLPNI